jgi:Tfp pilus assembly protein PilZ
MSNQRHDRRSPRRIQVRFWRPERPQETFHGFTSDVSEHGAFIVTSTPVGTKSRIRVELMTEHGACVAEGVVRRSRRVHRDLQAIRNSGMGVRFLSFAELVREILPQSGKIAGEPGIEAPEDDGENDPDSIGVPGSDTSAPGQNAAGHESTARTAPRSVAGSLEQPVRFRTWEDLRQIYERDLRHGGLFVATPNPSPVGTRIRIALYLPGAGDPLLADANVVQAFEPGVKPSQDRGSPGGMGVLFDAPERVLPVVRAALERAGTAPGGHPLGRDAK